MIVTCPACATRYLVDPRALGGGRMVRCAQCAHTWHQAAPADAPHRIDVLPPEPMGRIQLPALPPPAPRRGFGWGWALVLLVVLGLAYAAMAARFAIAELWPPAAHLYAALGLPVEAPYAGLDLRNLTFSRADDNVLVIEGEVVNLSDVARPVPRLKAMLRDEAGTQLESWTFVASDDRLLPGASATFRTSIVNADDTARRVEVTFDG